tara:strand:+ start:5117 stop:5353 length:237 start_codon:yes stop_codon:yes gene_type:complete
MKTKKGFQSDSLKKIMEYLESQDSFVTPNQIHRDTKVNFTGMTGVLAFLKEINHIEMTETPSNIVLVKIRRKDRENEL